MASSFSIVLSNLLMLNFKIYVCYHMLFVDDFEVQFPAKVALHHRIPYLACLFWPQRFNFALAMRARVFRHAMASVFRLDFLKVGVNLYCDLFE